MVLSKLAGRGLGEACLTRVALHRCSRLWPKNALDEESRALQLYDEYSYRREAIHSMTADFNVAQTSLKASPP